MGQLAHLDNYAVLPGVELSALAEGRPELARRVAGRYGIPRVYADHRTMLERAELDAVVAVMGFDLNWGVVRDIFCFGKQAATEKAMCLTPNGAAELTALARERVLVHQVGYMKRFDPAARQAQEWIAARRADGRAGGLLHARIWCAHGNWQWNIPRPISSGEKAPDYATPREARPEGMTEEEFRWVIGWLNYYSHQTNLLRALLGEDYEPEYFSSTAECDLAVVRTARGVPAVLEFPHRRVDGWDEGCDVTFQKAILRLRLPAPLARQQAGRLEIEELGEGVSIRPIAPDWSFAEQAKSFIAAVRGEGPEISPPEQAAAEVLLAHKLARMRRG